VNVRASKRRQMLQEIHCRSVFVEILQNRQEYTVVFRELCSRTEDWGHRQGPH
jgi:hypothetical protein